MRDFKLPEEPDLLPEDFQLDDPFAAEFIPEPLPGTKAAQEEFPAEETYPEEDIPEEFPEEFADISADDLADVSEDEILYEDVVEELPEDSIPEELPPLEETMEEEIEEPVQATDPEVLEEKLERPPHKGRPKRRSKVALFGLPHLAVRHCGHRCQPWPHHLGLRRRRSGLWPRRENRHRFHYPHRRYGFHCQEA